MKRNTKILFIVTILLFCVIVGYRFHQYFIEQNYTLYTNTVCDPETESCYSPDTDASVDDVPYKKVEIVARYAPACLSEHSCESFSCDSFAPEANCQITYCSQDALEDGEECYVSDSKE